MSQITGGTVTYGRTCKTGDYENKRVDVALNFSIEDGENADEVVDRVGYLAHKKAQQIIGLKPEIAEPTPAPRVQPVAQIAPAGKTDKDKLAEAVTNGKPAETETAVTPKRAQGRPPNKPPTAPPADPSAMDVVAEQPLEGAKIAAADLKRQAADPAQVDDDLTSLPTEITDKMLVETVSAHNPDGKNKDAIRKLIGQYNPSDGRVYRLYDIAQDKRQAFTNEVKALGK